jgi:hypothetical protein
MFFESRDIDAEEKVGVEKREKRSAKSLQETLYVFR